MKSLKWFSLEWSTLNNEVVCYLSLYWDKCTVFDTTQQAFTWLENNGYIERITQ